jgi:polyvinyl alcohol dehydrogenase (cytochrome)
MNMRRPLLLSVLVAVFGTVSTAQPQEPAHVADNAHDWPSYNRDAAGTRHNPVEKTLGVDNVGALVEKWRFPAQGSNEKIGVVHALVAVEGCVYFGTRSQPAVYRLTPEGRVRWSYRPAPRHALPLLGFGVPNDGFINAPLVTEDRVYIGDAGGRIFALERDTGRERWLVDTRGEPCPGAHPSNCIFAAPILAEGKIIVAGGGFEHAVALNPLHPCCTGRGFVAAFEPESGKLAWKYQVGPEPKKLDPPVVIKDAFGTHVFRYGPSTSSVWCTPSYEPTTGTLFFGTDCHNSPRQPTDDDPRLYTKHSCAVIALDAVTGKERWVTQINSDDVWNYGLPTYDKQSGRYKDQSIGDTPKPYWIVWQGRRRLVVGVGCKNGVFYVIDALTGEILFHTPAYTGPPTYPPPDLHPRTLALPSAIGGLQTGCATDGKAVFTNGIDMLGLLTSADRRFVPPTGGRVVSLSLDTRTENWRHERPRVKVVGGSDDKPAFTDVGDPVASGLAVANGVVYFTTTVSNKLVALDAATGRSLKEIDLGPVWCGPIVSRGRVYVGTGNLLFTPDEPREAYFPKSPWGSVRCFGLE